MSYLQLWIILIKINLVFIRFYTRSILGMGDVEKKSIK